MCYLSGSKYFLKPFNPVDLVNAVQKLTENKSFDTYYPMKAVIIL